MPPLFQAVILPVATFALGFGLAWLLRSRMRGKNTSTRALEEQFDRYRKEVETHFSQTADLLDELTEKYKNVHDHLSQTAQTLLNEEQLQRLARQRQGKGYKILVLEDKADTTEPVPGDADSGVETDAAGKPEPGTSG